MTMPTVKTNSSTIRILVVDDQSLIRQTIQMYLEQESDLEVIGYAENGTAAIKQIEELNPDVVMMDLEMPDMDGLTTIQVIRDRFSQVKILVLSSYDDRENINQAIKAGAKGYLTKATPAGELANAIRSVNQGYFQLGPGLMEKLVISMSNATEVSSKSLEDKLIIDLKKLKQDTNKQIVQLVKNELSKAEERFDHQLELKLHSLKRRYNELLTFARKIEFKLYLMLFCQIIVLFVGLAFWIVSS
ncbi:response regulator transcription factor [Pleurocapsa sp. PCC 7319]|uniref:response regulator n=1 Tax=Pleurocapsa sp. PCC 7319 TaxID=118161 RepID=UPI00034D228E|nr:response regulator transcription factor [Pleurocapsa sp. PCC 7319]